MLDAATFLPFFIVFQSYRRLWFLNFSADGFSACFRTKQSGIVPKPSGQYNGYPTRSASCGRLESGNSMRLIELNPSIPFFHSSGVHPSIPFFHSSGVHPEIPFFHCRGGTQFLKKVIYFFFWNAFLLYPLWRTVSSLIRFGFCLLAFFG